MNHERVVGVLDELIETNRDAQNGFREAAEHVKDVELRNFFNQQSTERARFAGELENEVERLGERDPNRKGSVAGALHRAWLDLKANLGGGERAILSSAEQGEDTAKKRYEKALAEPLPQNLVAIIRQQAQSILSAHDRVKALRDSRKAA
ncbi:MAG: PA2169 family four-helix-bundle protein [Acidobacteriales bacterium]|nr:PA2169 family four-helix-bundle protein [Terriglobales bacterium]